jgi:hypothetical protein
MFKYKIYLLLSITFNFHFALENSNSEKIIEENLSNRYGNILFKEYVDNSIIYICRINSENYIYIITMDKISSNIINVKKKFNDKHKTISPHVIYSPRIRSVTHNNFKDQYTNKILISDLTFLPKMSWDITVYEFLLKIISVPINEIFY